MVLPQLSQRADQGAAQTTLRGAEGLGRSGRSS
jgi:hypothetical protein